MKMIYNAMAMAPPLSGIGQYTLQLVSGMENNTLITDIHYLDYRSILNVIPDFATAGKESKILALLRTIARKPVISPMAYWYLQKRLCYKLKSYSDAIYHETNYLLIPFDGVSITTFHDLSFIHYRDFHPSDRIRLFDREIPKTLSRADHIITDSAFVKQELITTLGLKENNITVIPLGVSSAFCVKPKENILTTLQHYYLQNKRYILLVGSMEPRKNLVHFLAAYHQLPIALQQQHPIVHIGPSGWLNTAIVKDIEKLQQKGQFYRLGYVSEQHLSDLYAGAYIFAFPSIYEGFGLPVLEAMASGTPVLASNCSSIPEVIADAGVLTDPHDVQQTGQDLECLLTDTALQQQCREKGLQRAKQYTWQACIDKTLEVYQKLAV